MAAKKIVNPVVAIVGATGAVGVELLAMPRAAQVPAEGAQAVRVGALGRQDDEVPRQGRCPCRSSPRPASPASTSACSPPAAARRRSSRRRPSRPARSSSTTRRRFAWTPACRSSSPRSTRDAIFTHKGIIANPNCSAIISITPLWPVHRKNRIKRMIISTYQAASGAGAAAMEELRESTRAYLDGRQVRAQGAAAPVRVQRVQPQHQDRSRDGAQRGRDEGHQRDAQDLRRSRTSRSASPACASPCCARIACR